MRRKRLDDVKMDIISFFLSLDWSMLLAVLAAPFLAIHAQKRIEAFNERKGRQLYIFRVLMATRASPLNPEHVNALNLIDIDFSEKVKKEKPVIRAWRVLLDQYGKFPRQLDYSDNNQYMLALSTANMKVQDYLVDLLLKMSECLGYDFETIHIRNGCYAPTGHAEIEKDNMLIRKGAIALLAGDIPLNMSVKSLPEQEPHELLKDFLKNTSDRQAEMLELLQNILGENKNSPLNINNNIPTDTTERRQQSLE